MADEDLSISGEATFTGGCFHQKLNVSKWLRNPYSQRFQPPFEFGKKFNSAHLPFGA